MTERAVQVFFYGLFMDSNLLRSKGIVPANPQPAYVEDWALRIGNRAALVPAKGGRSYGMVMTLTHTEIDRLYTAPGLEPYRAEAVLAQTLSGETVAALCYNLPEAPAPDERNADYATQLRAVLRTLEFPAEYIASIS